VGGGGSQWHQRCHGPHRRPCMIKCECESMRPPGGGAYGRGSRSPQQGCRAPHRQMCTWALQVLCATHYLTQHEQVVFGPLLKGWGSSQPSSLDPCRSLLHVLTAEMIERGGRGGRRQQGDQIHHIWNDYKGNSPLVKYGCQGSPCMGSYREGGGVSAVDRKERMVCGERFCKLTEPFCKLLPQQARGFDSWAFICGPGVLSPGEAEQRICTPARNKRHPGDAPSNLPIVAGVSSQRDVGTLQSIPPSL